MDLEAVRAALRSDDEEVRHQAIAGLPTDGGDASLAVLIEAMGDESWRVRKEAVSRIAAWPAPDQSVPALCQALGEESNIARRNAAVEALSLIGRPAVTALLEELRKAGAERKLVIDALGAIGDARAELPLCASLRDEDPNVRAAAAEAIGHLGRRDAVPALLEAIRESDLLTRLAALEALNRLGASVPYPLLAPLLGEPVLRRAALEALGFAGDPDALPAMIAALGDRSRGAREAAATALVALHATVSAELASRIEGSLSSASGEALRGLCSTLASEARPLRRAAATLLGWARRAEALADLCHALRDEATQDVAAAAIVAYGPAAVGPLCDLSPDLDPDLRAQLFEVMPRLSPVADRRLTELFARAVCDDDEEPAAAAARALGAFAQAGGLAEANGAIAALFEALGREGPIAIAAAQALGASGVRYYDEVHAVVLAQGLRGASGPYLCRVLGACGRAADRPLLLAALKDESAILRRSAADALGGLGAAPEVTEALVFALSDESVSVRAAAARALGGLGDPTAVGALAAVAADGSGAAGAREEDPTVRAAAIRALGHVGDPAALPALRLLARSPEGILASAALEALAPLAVAADEPLLAQALDHPDPEAAKAAVRALGFRRTAGALGALTRALGHGRWDVRAAAVVALAGRPDPAVHAALRERLAVEEDELVRQALGRALRGRD